MTIATDLKDEVLAHQFNASRYGPFIFKWFDEGQRRIYRKARIRNNERTSTFQTTIGQSAYPLPSDFNIIRNVRINLDGNLAPSGGNEYTLQEFEVYEYDNLDKTARGRPFAYVIVDPGTGIPLKLYPVPDRAYGIAVRYWTLPPKISETVNPTLPSEYHELLVHYALIKAYRMEHDYEAAQIHDDQFQLGLVDLLSNLQTNRREGSGVVPGSWGGVGGAY